MKKNKKYIDIYLSPHELYNIDSFISALEFLEIGVRYSLLFRVCFGNTPTFKMLGNQVNFEFDHLTHKKDSLENLHNIIILRLETSLLNYNYSGGDIIAIQLLIYKVEYTDKLIKYKPDIFSLRKVGISNKLTSITSNKLDLGYNKVLPQTMDLDFYKNKLEVKSDSGFITGILINGQWVDFYSLIKKVNPFSQLIPLKDNLVFYTNNSGKYIIALDINHHPNNNFPIQYNISIYTYDGSHVLNVVDSCVDHNSFVRIIGNVTNTITKNSCFEAITVTNTSLKIKLEPVKLNKLNYSFKNLLVASPYIGTLDLETYIYKGISKVYAIGFYTKQYFKQSNIFYINPNTLDSNELILKCIDSMLVPKFSGYTFYVHNLGRYDIVFLLKPLINKKDPIYKLEIISRDGLILSLIISKKVGNKNHTIKIVDSYNMLSHKLKDLCKTYQSGVDITKDIFPYRFMNENTLFYTGDKPSIDFYEKPENEEEQEDHINTYNLIPNTSWSSKIETIKYLEKDLISLFQIISKFSDYTYNKQEVQVSNSLTISSLAMKIFLSKYYNKNIPLITKTSIYEDIKRSYFGGITEVYKPTNTDGEILYYYDVNSLYPFAALNSMPGLTCLYKTQINLYIKDIPNLFGFYYCKIKTTNAYLGLLPLRTKEGIIMPNGVWEGWYFSEELKFSAINGYEIFIIKGYNFNKEENVFNNYVDFLYNIKSTTNDNVERAVTKSLLNNLFGRFGLNINKPTTNLVDYDKFNELLQTKIINGVIPIDDQFLVTYNNKVSNEICNDANIDYKNTVFNNLKNREESEHTFSDVSIAIASAITSYARIFISKIKLDILNKGGSLYYSDTDSIVTNIPLNPEQVGINLGQFKLEHLIKKAYFISSKTYLIKSENKTIIKAKGVKDPTLDIDKFINLYKGLEVESKRTETYKDFSEGYVNLNTTPITLSCSAYTKRLKIYKNNMWIDTKPLVINNKV